MPRKGPPGILGGTLVGIYRLQFDYHTIVTVGCFFFRFGTFVKNNVISVGICNDDGVFCATVRLYDYKAHGCKILIRGIRSPLLVN